MVVVEYEFGRLNDSEMNSVLVGLTKTFYSQYEVNSRGYKEIRERRKRSELCWKAQTETLSKAIDRKP